MYCVSAPHHIEEILKKSRFIGVIAPCQTEQAALVFIAQLHAEHPAASHIAFAYRIQSPEGIRYRFHDAGEPSGTAGKPIYQHLEGKDLINVVVAVIRYFGGVKLGAGGLTRAYGNTAGNVIASAAITDYVPMCMLRLTLDYQQLTAFEYQLKKHAGSILQQVFAEQIQITLELPQANVDSLLQNVNVQCY
jgi:uncharacterized YigZ family protein